MNACSILFSAPMIRALLAGQKSQTRRIIKLPRWADACNEDHEFELDGDPPWPHAIARKTGCLSAIECPYGVQGDLLIVRETWQHTPQKYCSCPQPSEPSPCDDWSDGTGCRSNRGEVVYAADGVSAARWRPSIFMPRWASRLTLRITEIRVQRLQEISEEDAIAEGVTMPESEREERDFSLCSQCGGTLLVNRVNPSSGGMMFDSDCRDCETARDRYRHLWNYINGPDGWTTNPWCWALTFSVIQANVDEVMRREAA